MFTIRRSRSLFLGSAAFLALALFAPGVVSADEAIPLVAPVAGPATDAVPVVAPVAAPSVDETSADEVRAARALAAERALLSGDIGSMQEERLLAIVAAALSWDETSGYASVEASRATIGHPTASTTQVPSDVRWAPARAIAPDAEAAATRMLAAEQALQSHDLGSVQEEHLYAIVAAASSWDETSGYGSVEASRATIGHPAASTNDALPAALERGTRAESAVLWSILHQDDAVSVNPSDDRIANALFDDEPSGEDATVAVLHRTQH